MKYILEEIHNTVAGSGGSDDESIIDVMFPVFITFSIVSRVMIIAMIILMFPEVLMFNLIGNVLLIPLLIVSFFMKERYKGKINERYIKIYLKNSMLSIVNFEVTAITALVLISTLPFKLIFSLLVSWLVAVSNLKDNKGC